MEVKPGYKQTEIGVIPEEWEVKLLPEVLRFRGGKAHEQHISETGRYICVNSKFISTDGEVRKYSSANFCPANTGDVLMVMSDLPNGRALAKAYLVEKDDTYAVNQRVCALTAYRDCPEYFFYVLNRHPYFLKFDNGVSQTHLLNNVFQKCPIPVPPNVDEQRAIATALSDLDGLLVGLDRLIAKKRDLKQAAMQQLLTGQSRLPGFYGEWAVKTLGDIVEKIVGGGTPSRANPAFWGNEIPWVTVKDFATFNPRHSQESITRLGLRNSASHLIPAGTLITSTRMALGKAVVYEVDVTINQDLKALFLKPEVSVVYLTYWFEHFGSLIDELGSGSTVKGISLIELRRFPFQAPPHPEQTAIAEVLTEMDAELAGLEQRREKTRALKQAMMQELLTGRTRLI